MRNYIYENVLHSPDPGIVFGPLQCQGLCIGWTRYVHAGELPTKAEAEIGECLTL